MKIKSTSLCFVCAHLAAGQSNVRDRIEDYADITRGINFGKHKSIMSHNYVFWFGDFNFRIDLPSEDVKIMARKQNWSALYQVGGVCVCTLVCVGGWVGGCGWVYVCVFWFRIPTSGSTDVKIMVRRQNWSALCQVGGVCVQHSVCACGLEYACTCTCACVCACGHIGISLDTATNPVAICVAHANDDANGQTIQSFPCLLYTSPSPRD